MKPMDKAAHDHISGWVKGGGTLVYCGRDEDAFQSVQEWWNKDGNSFRSPSEHLFGKLGLKAPFEAGEYSFGKGKVVILRNDPKEFVLNPNADVEFINTVKKLYGNLEIKNHFRLTRGPYELISVVDENPDASPYQIKGKFIDLFDPDIPVLDEEQVSPGEQAFLYNINSVKNKTKPQVLATAARIYEEKSGKTEYSFVARSPLNTTNVMRLLLPHEPARTDVSTEATTSWDASSKTLFLKFENNPEGVRVKIAL
jgi:hypothetical protein